VIFVEIKVKVAIYTPNEPRKMGQIGGGGEGGIMARPPAGLELKLRTSPTFEDVQKKK